MWLTKKCRRDIKTAKEIFMSEKEVLLGFIAAMQFYSDDEFDKAIALFDGVIGLDPNHVKAYGYRGDCYKHKGDYDQAIADFDKAISLDPCYAEAYSERGSAYKEKAKIALQHSDYEKDKKYMEQAEADWRKGTQIANSSDYERGKMYLSTGYYDQAITAFSEAIKRDPKSTWAYAERGKAYRGKGDNDRAKADETEVENIRQAEKERGKRNRIIGLVIIVIIVALVIRCIAG
jgi:tetratricopeptide (TPR) repeat protein